MNRITLIGFLGQDAGVHSTKANQIPYTVLSLATSRAWKDRKTGERVSQTTWHRCVAWGKLADFASSLTKGMHLQIEGEVCNREYTQLVGGKAAIEVKKTATDIRVTSILKLNRPAKADQAVTAIPREVPA